MKSTKLAESAQSCEHEQEYRRYPFTAFDKRVQFDRRLSDRARFLYSILVSYAGQNGCSWYRYDRICADLGWAKSTLCKYLAELEGARLIRRENGGSNGTTIVMLPIERAKHTAPMPRLVEKRPEIKPDRFENQTEEKESEKENHVGEGSSPTEPVLRVVERPKPEQTAPEPPPPDLWERWTEAIQGQMSRANFDTWFADTSLIAYSRGPKAIRATIKANRFARSTLEERLAPMMGRVLRGVLGLEDRDFTPITLKFV